MARWRLTAKHYLRVPGTEWDYKEQSQETGKQVRKVFEVPMYLDPDSPGDWTENGDINVCYAGRGKPRDIVFEGPPTPDMEPLDDEAKEISAAERPKWVHPIESLPGTNYSQSLLDDLQKQVAN